MILEVADIHIKAGQQADFEKAVLLALKTIFAKAKGFRGHQFRHSIESPERYVLLLSWDTLEDHTVAFRGSALFTQWRSLISAYFAKPPYVEHFELVGTSATQEIAGVNSELTDEPSIFVIAMPISRKSPTCSRKRRNRGSPTSPDILIEAEENPE